MIGKGSVTFAGQRVVGSGETKSGSLIVPLSDVDGVAVENERVCVSVKQDNSLVTLAFEAASANEARHISMALERDELSEMQRRRSEASGRAILIDHSPPRCFVVAHLSNLSER